MKHFFTKSFLPLLLLFCELRIGAYGLKTCDRCQLAVRVARALIGLTAPVEQVSVRSRPDMNVEGELYEAIPTWPGENVMTFDPDKLRRVMCKIAMRKDLNFGGDNLFDSKDACVKWLEKRDFVSDANFWRLSENGCMTRSGDLLPGTLCEPEAICEHVKGMCTPSFFRSSFKSSDPLEKERGRHCILTHMTQTSTARTWKDRVRESMQEAKRTLVALSDSPGSIPAALGEIGITPELCHRASALSPSADNMLRESLDEDLVNNPQFKRVQGADLGLEERGLRTLCSVCKYVVGKYVEATYNFRTTSRKKSKGDVLTARDVASAVIDDDDEGSDGLCFGFTAQKQMFAELNSRYEGRMLDRTLDDIASVMVEDLEISSAPEPDVLLRLFVQEIALRNLNFDSEADSREKSDFCRNRVVKAIYPAFMRLTTSVMGPANPDFRSRAVGLCRDTHCCPTLHMIGLE